jgi:DTW domain-containing protein YfiP
MCWRCRRVAALCVCGLVRAVVGPDPIPNALGVTVLQDRKEALKRPFGSAIVAELALSDCRSVWYDTKVPERVPRPKTLPTGPSERVGVLFPGPGARVLRRQEETRDERRQPSSTKGPSSRRGTSTPYLSNDDDASSDAPEAASHGDTHPPSPPPPPTHLVVIDTTWHRARRMYARIPWLRELPAYVLGDRTPLVAVGDARGDGDGTIPRDGDGDGDGFGSVASSSPGKPSRGAGGGPRSESGYRIRKQPKPGFLSTAECIAAALREAEPGLAGEAPGAAGERAAAAVEACFDAMIDAQVRAMEGRKNVRYRSRKAERRERERAERARAQADGAETVLDVA